MLKARLQKHLDVSTAAQKLLKIIEFPSTNVLVIILIHAKEENILKNVW